MGSGSAELPSDLSPKSFKKLRLMLIPEATLVPHSLDKFFVLSSQPTSTHASSSLLACIYGLITWTISPGL
jgi:hypothetical protein